MKRIPTSRNIGTRFAGSDRRAWAASDLNKARISEIVSVIGEEGSPDAKLRRALYSPLWQADRNKIRRVAPLEFIGRYMPCRTGSTMASAMKFIS
jgi:hypothetical protein